MMVRGRLEGATGTGDGARPALSRLWAYAAAYGALWGAVEVTAGSFLHALRVPFSGVLLASLGAGLLAAQRRVFDRRGITAATGGVAALCKSLSPAGIIWNPMMAIAIEALLAELAFALAPRVLAPSAAGALAVLWAISQGLLMQYVLYGANIFVLYVTAIRKTAAWLGFAPGAGWLALAVVLAAWLLVGVATANWGARIGRLSWQRLERGHDA